MTPGPRAPAAAATAIRSLLDRCVAGDERAWHEIVDRYERLVFSVARREGLSVEDAADVTQATFEVLLDRLGDLREPERLAHWLMTVARRAAWRVRSRGSNDRRTETTADVPESPTESHELSTVRGIWLYEALQQLGEPCRSLLTALYLDRSAPTYNEIAIRMGRPVGSIGPSRARCLDNLRAILDATEEESA